MKIQINKLTNQHIQLTTQPPAVSILYQLHLQKGSKFFFGELLRSNNIIFSQLTIILILYRYGEEQPFTLPRVQNPPRAATADGVRVPWTSPRWLGDG